MPEWILKKGEGLGPFHKFLTTAPKIQGNTICIKWHLRGICDNGSECARKASHCVLSTDMAKEMTDWVKLCRADGK